MKFIVDAQLPRSLCAVLTRHGHDALHASDLPSRNATKDSVINQISLDERRVLISKDSDFLYSHLLQGRPWKLVMVKTGNISTHDLRSLFERHLPTIETALESHTLLEIDRAAVKPIAKVGEIDS